MTLALLRPILWPTNPRPPSPDKRPWAAERLEAMLQVRLKDCISSGPF